MAGGAEVRRQVSMRLRFILTVDFDHPVAQMSEKELIELIALNLPESLPVIGGGTMHHPDRGVLSMWNMYPIKLEIEK
jgi:hypothetical protein